MNSSRRNLLCMAGLTAVAASLPKAIPAAEAANPMKTMDCIATRRSVRAYKDQPVADADIQKILEMAMLAPSAANEQPWDFVVITDKTILGKVGDINHYAAYAANAPLAILLCLNESREKIKGMGILDMGMCAENLMLAAHALGIGSVFTGIYPEKDRMDAFAKLLNLPGEAQAIGLIVMGYPKINNTRVPSDRFNKSAIHYNKW